MKKIIITAAIILLGVLTATNSFAQNRFKSHKKNNSECAIELKNNMHKLWEEHITYSRNLILCLVDDLPGTDQAVKRLLQNQSDIGNAYQPFYGSKFNEKLSDLLKTHVNILAELVKTTKAGNSVQIDEVNKRWYANADKISECLNKENTFLPLTSLMQMMNQHIKLTNEEILLRINKDYSADIINYDKIHKHILAMSDTLSEGIFMQFPKRFKNCPKN